jgi:glycosyltransferase involved in cell wall biosynthesis
MQRKISLAIPHYNNTKYIQEAISCSLNDDRINEIIICDDKSKDINQLKEILIKINNNKIKLYENNSNLGCYHNKLETVSKCEKEWAILLDSDNIISTQFIDTLYDISEWDIKTIYAPSVAETFPNYISPNLNYTRFANQTITKEVYLKEIEKNDFLCLTNTCNYFLPVKQYLSCMTKETYDRNIIDSLDSAVLFTDWLCGYNTVFIVKNLKYHHRLHPESNYMKSPTRHYETFVRNLLIEKVKKMY